MDQAVGTQDIDQKLKKIAQLLLLIATFAFIAGAIMNRGKSPEEIYYNSIALPSMAIFCFLAFLIGFTKFIRPQIYTAGSILALSSYLVFRVYVTLMVLPILHDFRIHLGPITPWLPLVLVAKFIMLSRKTAVVSGILYWLALVAIVYFFLQSGSARELSIRPSEFWVQQFLLAIPAFIVLLSALSYYREYLASVAVREKYLTTMAMTDPLTGLNNRRSMDQMLLRDIARLRRGGGKFSVVVVDVDFFKGINDRFGHQTGDRVLKRVAKLLSEGLRTSDWCGRWGGEEFLIGVEGSLEEAKILAERLRSTIHQDRAVDTPPITVSMGVATYRAEDEDSIEAMVARADKALYQAKSSGRNRVELELNA